MDGSKASGKAGLDGRWLVRVKPPKSGGPYKVVVDGSKRVELDDVLVGGVWLCTGQSNMELGLTQANGGTEVASADRPQIRLFMAPRQIGYAPKAVNGGMWKVCTPTTVAQDGWGGFSAVGYFFGKRLQDTLKVPVGLVEDCWGGGLEGQTIVVRSVEVPHPVAVRYAWGHNPEVNLTNATGFPAVPFRTDDWPLVTRDAK